MNDLKIGYVVITTNEYKELVLKEKELEAVIEDCENQISNLKEMYSGVEDYIFNQIYNNEQWDIKQLEYKDGVLDEEYHYKELVQCFIKKGINNTDFISTKILELYKKYKEEHMVKENEN